MNKKGQEHTLSPTALMYLLLVILAIIGLVAIFFSLKTKLFT